MLSLISFLLALSTTALATNTTNTTLPTVDLGYRLQRATVFNTTGQYYNFSNIRYAAPPTGDLRFRAPEPPAVDRSQVFTGETGKICPQADPAWLSIADQFLVDLFVDGKTGNYTPADFSNGTTVAAGDGRVTEDCLFLDVLVSKPIFEGRGRGKGVPVLVWIYGGGYTAGSKEASGNPAGLLGVSEEEGEGVVYVAMNYRLGAFGWLAGPSFQAEGGIANAGLYDQRLALEWVREHAAKFGGDPRRVTVFGESAGGGSIMHQITAFGGARGPVPFQRAIPQSPGFFPIVSPVVQENTTQTFLQLLNVSTLAQARALPYATLQKANVAQVGASDYGQFTYGPVVDGVFAPSLPGQLLARGQFDKSVRVMVGHNADEGILFTSPFISTNADLLADLELFLPTAVAFPKVLDYITSVLYPPNFTGIEAENYTTQITRSAALTAEASFVCNTRYMAAALPPNATYSYLFAVPPAYHGLDLGYTFYNGASGVNATVARALQGYILNFATSGVPGGGFPAYGEGVVQVLNVTGIGPRADDAANARCAWWQKALYY